MKYLQNYDNFINESIWRDTIVRNAEGRVRTEDSLEVKLREFCDRHTDEYKRGYHRKIEDFTITSDGKVDCSDSVMIWGDDLVNGKLPFKFGEVNGCFDCSSCDSITSLEGCPDVVDKYFSCTGCKNIKSLKNCPKEVRRSFSCNGCGKEFTRKEVRKHCDVKGDIYV